ncbi:hypothetical protein [Rhodopseudomonas palustris]|uniref:hypothetical protein n=1 Tax=Rhodopseudomonas palustris TaxID=1076 RepID=UPI001F400A21|nr:hypothetical protein [Rhodopseudomonas palustris]
MPRRQMLRGGYRRNTKASAAAASQQCGEQSDAGGKVEAPRRLPALAADLDERPCQRQQQREAEGREGQPIATQPRQQSTSGEQQTGGQSNRMCRRA